MSGWINGDADDEREEAKRAVECGVKMTGKKYEYMKIQVYHKYRPIERGNS